jgi:hypothetical protein
MSWWVPVLTFAVGFFGAWWGFRAGYREGLRAGRQDRDLRAAALREAGRW